MSEFIDREKAIANIKAAYCCGCEHYNGVRCRACQIMDAMDVLEDEPAVPVIDAESMKKYLADWKDGLDGSGNWGGTRTQSGQSKRFRCWIPPRTTQRSGSAATISTKRDGWEEESGEANLLPYCCSAAADLNTVRNRLWFNIS